MKKALIFSSLAALMLTAGSASARADVDGEYSLDICWGDACADSFVVVHAATVGFVADAQAYTMTHHYEGGNIVYTGSYAERGGAQDLPVIVFKDGMGTKLMRLVIDEQAGDCLLGKSISLARSNFGVAGRFELCR